MSLSSPSDLESFPTSPLVFGRVLVLSPLYTSCSFKPCVFFAFFLCPRTEQSIPSTVLSLPTAVCSIGGGDSLCYPSFLLSCHFFYLWLFNSCWVSPQFFFRRNHSIDRCSLGCSAEEVSSESSYIATLKWNPEKTNHLYFNHSYPWNYPCISLFSDTLHIVHG